MQIEQSGFILYVRDYHACAKFYKEVLELPILYTKNNLSCFAFGSSYLMVELDDEYDKENSIEGRPKTCLRLNVKNVKESCKLLDRHGIKYTYGEYSWGTIAKFKDPDDNLIGFRSAKEHIDDMKILKP